MGLNVTAHKNIKFLSMNEPSDNQWDEGVFRAFVITPKWNNRISELKIDGYYIPKESESFVRYAYSNHFRLRNAICRLIGVAENSWRIDELEPGSDFEEWLNFADNEGVLDCKTSKKLLQDFKNWEREAEQQLNEWHLKNYKNWIETFEFASENGAVEYH